MGSLRDAGRVAGAAVVGVPVAGAVLVAGAWWYAEGGAPGHGLGAAALASSLGRLAGLLAGYLLLVQVLLAARLPVLERRVGLDALLRWHRRNGTLLFAVVAVHLALVVGATQQLARLPGPWAAFRSLVSSRPGVVLAVAAGVLFTVVAAVSVTVVRARLPYEMWYAVHLSAYAAIALTVPHQVLSGSTLAAVPGARPVWVAAYVAAGTALVGFRWVRPAVRANRHRMQVVAVVPEARDVASLRVQVRRPDRLTASAGQFFIWRGVSPGQWWRPHPLSLSAAPAGDTLRVTMQTVGSGTATMLAAARPGTAIVGEGPYGAFTADRCRGRGVLLLGGGVGITPLRALAEVVDDRDGVVLLHRVSEPGQVLFAAELAELATRRSLSVRALVGPRRRPGSWLPELPGLPDCDADALLALVPGVARRDVFVCGPPAWVDLVRASLSAAGVPRPLVHVERFAW